MKINVNIYPKDSSGYRFKEADGTVFVGGSWKAVIERVRGYRARNNLPMGDPESEVNAQACQKNPTICAPDNPQHKTQLKAATLKGRILQWFGKIRSAPRQHVDADKAQQRANVCAGCQNNQPLPGGCSSCKKALAALRGDVLGGRPVDSRLVDCGCLILGHESSTAVWLDEQTVENQELPGHCWRKRG